jgi:hypothetical protein
MGNAQITSSSEYVTIKTGQTMPSPYNNVKEISKYYTENKNNNGQLINIDGTHIALGGKPIYYIIFYEPAGYWITKSYFPLSIEQTTKNSPIDEFRIYVDDNLKVTNIVKYSFKSLSGSYSNITVNKSFVTTCETTGTNKDASCFPFDAVVTTPTGKKSCEDLVLGEQVLVDHKGTFEPILFFGHRENYETLFVELTLANGNKMSATPQHYIFSYNNKKKTLIPIQDVRTGDFVKYNGKRIKIAEIAMIRKKGIVSPMTKSCEIVIDGVQASCCTDKYTLTVLKPLVDAVDALGITVPLQVVDPIRDIGNIAIKKFHL